MTIIKVGDKSVELNIEEELREYSFDNARWQSDKLVASSPFRSDHAPSFFVNLEGEYAGTWGDSGAVEYEYTSGNFVKLITLLNGFSYEEAGDYLLDKYGSLYDARKEGEPIRIRRPKLRETVRPLKTIDNPIKQAISPYLVRRGICPRVQAMYGVGYDGGMRGFTAIPIRTEVGTVANVFYRSTSGKRIYYAENAMPKNRLVFGADLIGEITILCEGVIDALSWETLGYSAIAVGGASISRDQAEIIKRSAAKRVYLAGDNDEQGRELNRQACRELRGYKELFSIDYGKKKDANDALLSPKGVRMMQDIFENAEKINTIRLRVS